MGVEQDFRTEAEPEISTAQNWIGWVALLTGLLGASLVALVLGVFGLRAVQRGRATNRGVSVAALVLAAIGFVAWIALGAYTVFNADSTGAQPLPTPGATRYVLAARGGSDTSLVAPAAAYLASHVHGEVSVGKDGRSIVVVFKTPATADDAAALVATGAIQVRPVISSAPPAAGAGTVTAKQSSDQPAWTGDEDFYVTPELARAFAATDCTKPAPDPVAAAHDAGVVACAGDGSAKFLLGAVAVDGSDVLVVRVNGATVNLMLSDQGQSSFGDVTSHLARLAAPANGLAFTLDGLVQSAPEVKEAIPGGAVQMQLPDAAAAQRVAGALALGHLVTFTVTAR